ncbi:acetyl-CoA/propionyl-CoA carboxylase, biotin carboxylase, biotin carboxyl carrier protein [Actinokineospora alba]|uniref:Biotin-dependent 3-methylcrotonyl-coenzyme A carboxylase alpha1 subunit n=1 Tax=Actinokineospora alba TaxID=504798 RepID=A0A1H0UEZ8_9PSEU|nr:acetyl/propionyl/methylcrotonyl-CoA carboxylase subunit alpha [Actinokineospora alba]TDP65137.1 acetyl-CoA carboxylase biotin carboxylase subunit [Actinokineospora alba]SDH54905.1 acetyl-CoA/propionyl-CoA carboxylase, biotin carboxylase, biotin carboxyl carrier protein [Actinokineospora alba]SDP64787.1 acetyl-CoA/propionyl-CoA carboxylase, biotin carboxylase, biotin carboxyl carrier protein [Actinokineospora alba]
MFTSVLIANRGEIACRVIDTLRRMRIRSVAVYSDADAGARHVREADVAVRIGPAAARESYLSIPNIIAAARETGAEAVHPGYGFLAENVEFARACAEAGLVFIGPPASAIDAMGDKIRAKLTVIAAGVPVVPGRTEPGMSDDDLVSAATEIGFPVLLKPSAGGGGKGMRLVTEPEGLRSAIESARREARGSFGDETLLIERFVQRPRHIEIQVLADAHGNVIHLGERECSLQRRHQKIIEEAPSPLLDAVTRERMGTAAVDAAKSVGYTGAGTVEFIVSADRPDEFFFMEMNTRLQVEHPVTEQVTGLDLVEQQVRVAAGEPLSLKQSDVELRGHSVEARVYAEDPSTGFLPTGGRVLGLSQSTEDWARLDSGLLAGSVVGSDYDPMLAKVITWGEDREQALIRLSDALADTVVLGVGTNIAFLRALLADEDVRAGRLDTQLVERKLDALTRAEPVPDEVFAAAALDELLTMQPAGEVIDPWSVPNGWRLGRAAVVPLRLTCGDRDVRVKLSGSPSAATVTIDDGDPVKASVSRVDGELRVTYGGHNLRYTRAQDGDVLWLAAGGQAWAVAEHSMLEGAGSSAAAGGPVTSPMPGTVLVVKVAVGDHVTAGQPLLVVEAMKMEHTITAKVDGVVSELNVHAGQQVALNQILTVVTPTEDQS